MRAARILFKGEDAGVLTQHDDGSFTFTYQEDWLSATDKPPVSLTLPKSEREYHAKFLFPFFYNMLPEGSNRQMVCDLLRIDTDDYFGLLMATAKDDVIGAVSVIKIQ